MLSAANALTIGFVWWRRFKGGIDEEEPASGLTEAQEQELSRRVAELDASPGIATPWGASQSRRGGSAETMTLPIRMNGKVAFEEHQP